MLSEAFLLRCCHGCDTFCLLKQAQRDSDRRDFYHQSASRSCSFCSGDSKPQSELEMESKLLGVVWVAASELVCSWAVLPKHSTEVQSALSLRRCSEEMDGLSLRDDRLPYSDTEEALSLQLLQGLGSSTGRTPLNIFHSPSS